jgi:hypothetical protein
MAARCSVSCFRLRKSRPATTMSKDDDDDHDAAANAIIAASAPASVAASACTRADSCRQHMCPLLLSAHLSHPSPVTWQCAREEQSCSRLPVAPSSLLSAPAKLVCTQLECEVRKLRSTLQSRLFPCLKRATRGKPFTSHHLARRVFPQTFTPSSAT